MKLRNSVRKLFSYIFLFGVVTVSFFPRKAHAMDLRPAAIGQSTQKEEVITKLVTVTITPTQLEQQGSKKQSDSIKQQTPDSEKIPAFSGETPQAGGSTPLPIQQLGGSMPISTTAGSLRSTGSQALSIAAKSPKLRSSKSGSEFTQLATVSNSGGSQRGPGSLSSLSLSARDLDPEMEYHGKCCGWRIPQFEVYASKKQLTFNAKTAQENLKSWNKAIDTYVLDIHKPKPLPKNLDDISPSDKQLIFGGSEPVQVFSNKCRDRVTNHLKKLAKKDPGKGPMTDTPTYDPKTLIFDNTVPEGYYIESFTFRRHYAVQSEAKDNRDQPLFQVALKDTDGVVQMEGLISPPDPTHQSTSYHGSSTHADLFMHQRKENWGYAGAVSNHTGRSLVDTTDYKKIKAGKLSRYATYNPKS